MKVVYAPEGAEPRTWEFKPEKLMSPECIAIERLTGMRYAEWKAELFQGSITAQHALLWVLLKRQAPTLRADQVEFSESELSLDLDDDEARQLIERMRAAAAGRELTDDERAGLADVETRFPHLIEDAEDPKAEPLRAVATAETA
jgi:hypothetical protein